MKSKIAKLVAPQAYLANRYWPWVRKARQKRFLMDPEGSDKNFVFVHYPHRIPEAQYYPFHYYRREIESRFGLRGTHLESTAVPLLEARVKKPLRQVKLVAVQTHFSTSREEVHALFSELRELFPDASELRELFPDARYAYFDWFAPTDLRMANLVDEHVDLYVKKNLLKDFTEYEKSHEGDTNLTDYYGIALRHRSRDQTLQDPHRV